MHIISGLGAVFGASFLFTWFLLLFFRWNNHVDIPGDRSSHITSTPTSGGIGFVAVFIVSSYIFDYFFGGRELSPVVVTSFFLICLLGVLDDFFNISALYRLGVHIMLCVSMLFSFSAQLMMEYLGFYALFFLFFLSCWFVNLYNFMDGIDGLAALQAVVVFGALGWLLVVFFQNYELAWYCFALVASVLGFLFWNFPRAKLFMGDGGSGFLGFVVAFFAIKCFLIEFELFMALMILMSVFVVDATYTLVVRIVKRQKFLSPHKSHAYQILSRKLESHWLASVIVFSLNLFVLVPLSYFVVDGAFPALLGVSIAYAIVVFVAIYLRAGLPQTEQ